MSCHVSNVGRKSTRFEVCLLCCELPIVFRLKAVTISLLGWHRGFDFRQAPNAAVQTLANHNMPLKSQHFSRGNVSHPCFSRAWFCFFTCPTGFYETLSMSASSTTRSVTQRLLQKTFRRLGATERNQISLEITVGLSFVNSLSCAHPRSLPQSSLWTNLISHCWYTKRRGHQCLVSMTLFYMTPGCHYTIFGWDIPRIREITWLSGNHYIIQ